MKFGLSLSLFLTQKHRLRSVVNRVLRKILGRKREEVAEDGERVHKEEFHILYVLQNISMVIRLRYMRWARPIARMGEMKLAYKILIRSLK
jgi:hypothetical protein